MYLLITYSGLVNSQNTHIQKHINSPKHNFDIGHISTWNLPVLEIKTSTK